MQKCQMSRSRGGASSKEFAKESLDSKEDRVKVEQARVHFRSVQFIIKSISYILYRAAHTAVKREGSPENDWQDD